MFTLPSWLPDAFPALALGHFAALVSPGPDFFLIIGHAARHHLRGSVGICAGIAAGNAVYILLAALGWTGLKDEPALYRILQVCGALYLGRLGWLLIRSAATSHTLHEGGTALSYKSQFMTGLASALLNPKNALFYLTLMTAITGVNTTLMQQGAAGVYMVVMVLIWDVAIAGAIGIPHVQAMVRSKLYWVERASGAVLLLFAIGLLAEMVWLAW